MLQGIIFDLDGVIVDSHAAHKKAWRGLLTALGREVDEAALEFVVEGRKRAEILRHFLGDASDEDVSRYGAWKDQLFCKVAHEVQTLPGVAEFVKAADAAGLRLAVGTSAARRRAQETLETFGLASHFGTVVTGDEVCKGKPDPAIFLRAAAGLGLAPEHLLVCEDAVPGVQAAKSAGMKCLGIAANGRRAFLESAGADWIAEDFRQVSVENLLAEFAHCGSMTRSVGV
ncbi:MAG: HAD family hydrolase [Actinomycetota bacterium]